MKKPNCFFVLFSLLLMLAGCGLPPESNVAPLQGSQGVSSYAVSDPEETPVSGKASQNPNDTQSKTPRVETTFSQIDMPDYEGFILSVDLTTSQINIEQVVQSSGIVDAGVEDGGTVSFGADRLTINFSDKTEFTLAVSDNATQTTTYYEATETDLKEGMFLKIQALEDNGAILATKVLVMSTK